MNHEYCKTINKKITKENLIEWQNDPKSFNAYMPRLRDEYKVIEPLLKKNDYILDVGCRNGAFLEILKNNGYENLLGIDICTEAVEETLSKGIECIEYDIQEDDVFTPETFDVITLFHVMEHISNPIRTCDKVHKILKTDGIVFIEIPVHAMEPPEAWGHFSIYTDGNQINDIFQDRFKCLFLDRQKVPSKKPWYRYIFKKI